MRQKRRIVATFFSLSLFSISAFGYEEVSRKDIQWNAYPNKVAKIIITPTHGLLYSVGNDSNSHIKVWDWIEGNFLYGFDYSDIYSISEDGSMMIMATPDYAHAVLLDTIEKSVLHTFEHYSILYGATFSQDTKTILTAGDEFTQESELPTAAVKIWDVQTGALLETILRPPIELGGSVHFPYFSSCIGFSAGGSLIYLGSFYPGYHSSGMIYAIPYGELIRPSDWQTLHLFETVRDFTFSPSGDQLALDHYEDIDVYNSDTYEKLFSLENTPRLYGYSPNGNFILTETLKISDWGVIWDSNTGEPIAAIPDAGGYSTAGAWSPDGNKVVIGGYDGTITVWDVSEYVESSVGEEAEVYGER